MAYMSKHLNDNENKTGLDPASHSGQWRGNRKGRRRIPVFVTIVIDVLIAALTLYIFSLAYFILPKDLSGSAVTLPNSTVSESAAPSASKSTSKNNNTKPDGKESGAVSKTAWGDKFKNKFTTGKVVKTANSYKSANINVTIKKVKKDDAVYYVADIYLSDLKYFKTAFAKGKFGSGYHDSTDTIAKENNAILAINGDYCGDNAGPVVRNGVLYRDEIFRDVLVMNNDGSMQTYSAQEFDMDKIKKEGAYQVWTFGPMLLKDGKPMTKFNSTLNPKNPRTAVGYYEPGHYCFVVVDGRQPGYSNGMELQELSKLFYDLGCKAAFNLDGGQSSEMALMGKLVNQPYDGGRSTSDILYIADK